MILTEEQLAVRAAAGDELAIVALFARYEPVLRALARDFYAPGLELDDLVQEAAFGLYKAVRDWRPAPDAAWFATFARMCITRQLITALKTATRSKHGPLNRALSLDRQLDADDGGGSTLAEVLPAPASWDPAQVLADRAELEQLLEVIETRLSPLERECLFAFMAGETMRATQLRLGRPLCETSRDEQGRPRPKVVENAIDRANRKMRVALVEADAVPLDVAA